MRKLLLCLFLAGFALGSCKSADVPAALSVPAPIVLGVTARAPQLIGTMLDIQCLIAPGSDAPYVRLTDPLTHASIDLSPTNPTSANGLTVMVSSAVLSTFGAGSKMLNVAIATDIVESAPFPASFDFEDTPAISLSLVAVPGEIHVNDAIPLVGDGFLDAGEGQVVANISGTFQPDDAGEGVTVNVNVPVFEGDSLDRQHGMFTFTPNIIGLHAGTLTAMVMLTSGAGATSTSSVAVPFNVDLGSTFLTGLRDATVYDGNYIYFEGGGFVGGDSQAPNTTIFLIDGSFTPDARSDYDPTASVEIHTQLVPEFLSGGEMRALLDVHASSDAVPHARLMSTLFGARRGTFTGMLSPVVTDGVTDYPSTGANVTFTVAPKQVVFIDFLGNFYDTLAKYGLSAGVGTVEPLVQQRIQNIYGAYNVDVRITLPQDVPQSAFTTVEIGGPDPNGIGLFGYDDAPGKDRGNVLLSDVVGGANWMQLASGNPGYGGVFIESFLAFSTNPNVVPASIAPGEGPAADPLFDQVFGEVIAQPATFLEALGMGPNADRNRVVAEALHAFANMVGETAAHEFGHSLGMANPLVSGAPHDTGDQPGCLMESGSGRPLSERIASDGAAASAFCHGEAEYLADILGP